MSRFHDFDAARAESTEEPLGFRLGGFDFDVRVPIPAGPILDLGAASDKEGEEAFVALSRFLDVVVAPEQQLQLRSAFDLVGLRDVIDVVRWLIQEATNRPLESASPSPGAGSVNGGRSKLEVASEGWTPLP